MAPLIRCHDPFTSSLDAYSLKMFNAEDSEWASDGHFIVFCKIAVFRTIPSIAAPLPPVPFAQIAVGGGAAIMDFSCLSAGNDTVTFSITC